MRPTLIERIGVCSTLSSEAWVPRSCACYRVVGHGSGSAMQQLRCDRSWKALCGTAKGEITEREYSEESRDRNVS
jgi:hypothetical protein